MASDFAPIASLPLLAYEEVHRAFEALILNEVSLATFMDSLGNKSLKTLQTQLAALEGSAADALYKTGESHQSTASEIFSDLQAVVNYAQESLNSKSDLSNKLAFEKHVKQRAEEWPLKDTRPSCVSSKSEKSDLFVKCFGADNSTQPITRESHDLILQAVQDLDWLQHWLDGSLKHNVAAFHTKTLIHQKGLTELWKVLEHQVDGQHTPGIVPPGSDPRHHFDPHATVFVNGLTRAVQGRSVDVLRIEKACLQTQKHLRSFIQHLSNPAFLKLKYNKEDPKTHFSKGLTNATFLRMVRQLKWCLVLVDTILAALEVSIYFKVEEQIKNVKLIHEWAVEVQAGLSSVQQDFDAFGHQSAFGWGNTVLMLGNLCKDVGTLLVPLVFILTDRVRDWFANRHQLNVQKLDHEARAAAQKRDIDLSLKLAAAEHKHQIEVQRIKALAEQASAKIRAEGESEAAAKHADGQVKAAKIFSGHPTEQAHWHNGPLGLSEGSREETVDEIVARLMKHGGPQEQDDIYPLRPGPQINFDGARHGHQVAHHEPVAAQGAHLGPLNLD